MTCQRCGRENAEDAVFCAFCGVVLEAAVPPPVSEPQTTVGPAAPAPPPPPPAVPPPTGPPPQMPGVAYPYAPVAEEAPTSGLAVASVILGVLGFFTAGITGLLGLVLGIAGLVQISRSEGRVKGQGLALAGTLVSGFTVLMLPILAAILFPVFARAREKARQASCLSNLKQISLGVLMYNQDYDLHYPPKAQWGDAVMPYLRNSQLFMCPSAGTTTQRSYAYNSDLEELTAPQIPFPAEAVMAFDSQPGANPAGNRELVAPRHSGGPNVALVDGHVKWFPMSGLDRLQWHPAAGQLPWGGLPAPTMGMPPGIPMPPGMPTPPAMPVPPPHQK